MEQTMQVAPIGTPVKVDRQGRLRLPRAMTKTLKLKGGETFESWTTKDNLIVFKPTK